MAPLSRGNARRRGSSSRGRGGAVPRGRGGAASRGRGGGFHSGGRGIKSTFYSTRVEEPLQDGYDGTHSSEDEDQNEVEDISGPYSSEDDIEAYSIITKPYNELLQSLHGESSSGQAPRKRQKLPPIHTDAISSVDQEPDIALKEPGGADIDYVEEPEEGGGVQAEALDSGGSDDESEAASDPFEIHFAGVDEKRLSDCIKDAVAANQFTQKSVFNPGWKTLSTWYRCISPLSGPRTETLLSVNDLQLKQRLEITAKKNLPSLDGVSKYIAAQMYNYHDLLFCDRKADIAQDLRMLACLHALNHVFKTRDKVIKNNARLAKIDGSDDIEYRDQGFTRPKVLMLLPTRQACVKAVDTMVSLCEPEQQENKKRFQDSYTQPEDNFSEDKPEDFRELFEGNDDDMFRIGVKFTRKTVKYFSQFYNSDIILASPLGLRMAIGTEDTKKRDHDFLSSIEVVIVDQADALLMQNWEHVEYVFEHLNLQPKEAHGCDFSRVRNWYLDGHARFLRQTIVLTAFNTPELNKIYGRHMMNIAGKTKICREEYGGTMLDLGIQIKQTFSRYDAFQPTMDPDARFKYFTTAVIPMLTKTSKTTSRRGQGVLVFIPSYMDFVRVRNFLANSNSTQNISFGSVSEYTSVSDVARARSHFFSGRHSVLLYTGRAHHFRRYRLRGVKSIVMYGLPDNPLFYQEIVGGYLATSISEGRIDSMEASVRSLFSKWDVLKLERIVGTRRSGAMLREKYGDTFDFL